MNGSSIDSGGGAYGPHSFFFFFFSFAGLKVFPVFVPRFHELLAASQATKSTPLTRKKKVFWGHHTRNENTEIEKKIIITMK